MFTSIRRLIRYNVYMTQENNTWATTALQEIINQMPPIDRLHLWKQLQDQRDQNIITAKTTHTWAQIQKATGLSRPALNNAAKRAKPET